MYLDEEIFRCLSRKIVFLFVVVVLSYSNSKYWNPPRFRLYLNISKKNLFDLRFNSSKTWVCHVESFVFSRQVANGPVSFLLLFDPSTERVSYINDKCKPIIEIDLLGASLGVQWLRLWASAAGDTGSMPGGGNQDPEMSVWPKSRKRNSHTRYTKGKRKRWIKPWWRWSRSVVSDSLRPRGL